MSRSRKRWKGRIEGAQCNELNLKLEVEIGGQREKERENGD